MSTSARIWTAQSARQLGDNDLEGLLDGDDPDDDNDGISDAYEEMFGLDPYSAAAGATDRLATMGSVYLVE